MNHEQLRILTESAGPKDEVHVEAGHIQDVLADLEAVRTRNGILRGEAASLRAQIRAIPSRNLPLGYKND